MHSEFDGRDYPKQVAYSCRNMHPSEKRRLFFGLRSMCAGRPMSRRKDRQGTGVQRGNPCKNHRATGTLHRRRLEIGGRWEGFGGGGRDCSAETRKRARNHSIGGWHLPSFDRKMNQMEQRPHIHAHPPVTQTIRDAQRKLSSGTISNTSMTTTAASQTRMSPGYVF
jgi:hypothetical protein